MLKGLKYLVALVLSLVGFTSCPPLRFEDVYGYNSVVLQNESDLTIVALYVYPVPESG